MHERNSPGWGHLEELDPPSPVFVPSVSPGAACSTGNLERHRDGRGDFCRSENDWTPPEGCAKTFAHPFTVCSADITQPCYVPTRVHPQPSLMETGDDGSTECMTTAEFGDPGRVCSGWYKGSLCGLDGDGCCNPTFRDGGRDVGWCGTALGRSDLSDRATYSTQGRGPG